MKFTFSASVTPLNSDGTFDKQGIKNVLKRNVRHGLDGVFLLGSMGEWFCYDDQFKEEYVKFCSEAFYGKLELLVGINATCSELSLKNMERYSKYDFDCYVYMLPGRPASVEPVSTLKRILDAADRPVWYYHCPPNNGINLSLDNFAEIMKHPNLRGIKNSSSSMWLRRELLLMRKEKGFKTLLFEGQEWACDEALQVGNDGVLFGMGALASKPMVKLVRAIEAGDTNKARDLQNLLINIYHGIYGRGFETVCNGQKYALHKLGLIKSANAPSAKIDSLSAEAKSRINQCLEQYAEELD